MRYEEANIYWNINEAIERVIPIKLKSPKVCRTCILLPLALILCSYYAMCDALTKGDHVSMDLSGVCACNGNTLCFGNYKGYLSGICGVWESSKRHLLAF